MNQQEQATKRAAIFQDTINGTNDQETESETPEPARHDGPERRHADLKSTLDRFRTRLKENLDGLNTTPPASGPDRNRGQRKTL